MCEECRQSPCHPRCPNAPDPRAVFVCSGCSQDIYEGDWVFHIMGEQYCEKCIEGFREEATLDDFDF